MPNLGPIFYKKLLQISSDVGMKPEDVLNVMSLESGLDPTAHNKNGNASGLVQFMPDTLKGLGFQGSHSDFRELNAVQQLDYVKKWLQGLTNQNGGPLTAVSYYIGNFLPVALKLPGVKNKKRNTIIVARNPKRPHLPGVDIKRERSYYKANPVLDYNKDGFITYGDIEDILKQYAAGKNFQSALAQMQQSTGYVSGQKNKQQQQPSMLANQELYQKYNQTGGSVPPTVNNLLDSFLKNLAASEKFDKKLYQQLLPQNDILITIESQDYSNSIEFSRILCSALNTELLAKAFIHTDNEDVEIECQISGPAQDCLATVKQLTASISEAFYDATNKIGSIKINANVIMNKKSSYQQINLKFAETQYRKFLLKFI